MADMGSRVVAHFDLDCFYAQVEEMRHPEHRGKPLGVTQKFLVVTTNYAARNLGVPKMVSIAAARDKCPSLILVNGEDLSPYREASRSIFAVLSRFGTLERLGLDEAVVDLTAEVAARVRLGIFCRQFSGHVVGESDASGGEERVMVGSQVAAEIRAAVERETGYRCSCGISHNKMGAKLVGGLHKPNDQTSILPSALLPFLRPLPIRRLPGVGHHMEGVLKGVGVERVEQMEALSLSMLRKTCGEKQGSVFFHLCRATDPRPVASKGFLQSFGVEDSFRTCTTLPQAKAILTALAPDLIARLDEDRAVTARVPQTFTLKWRTHSGGWKFSALSCPMPADAVAPATSLPHRIATVVRTALTLLTRAFANHPFHLLVLNIGAANCRAQGGGVTRGIRNFLEASPAVLATDESADGGGLTRGPAPWASRGGGLVGKRQARALREGGRGAKDGSGSEGEGEREWADIQSSTYETSQPPLSVPEPGSGVQVNHQAIPAEDSGCPWEVASVGLDMRAKGSGEAGGGGMECSECRMCVAGGDAGWQEHRDFHLATRLEREERAQSLNWMREGGRRAKARLASDGKRKKGVERKDGRLEMFFKRSK